MWGGRERAGTPAGVLMYSKTSSMLCSHSYLQRVTKNIETSEYFTHTS